MVALPHYPSAQARSADLFIHLLGLSLAIIGGVILLWMAIQDPAPSRLAVTAVYSIGAVCMFGFSTAYNFAPAKWKPFLRRLDHVGIFLMIAATYTPFTAYLLSGAWAWSLTASLWFLAGLGILGKIFLPPISQKVWVPIYLGLAWIGAIAAIPLADNTSGVVLWLLALGGIFYSAGVLFYTNKRLEFAKAIWHGHVVAAASTHWAAVLVGLFVVRS
ncbi:PAQR family membrane homeostasis protein TrhA [Devosia psychrophila]|uniref:Hemolysin III n=1 Tax=Devosia psychrophila TaxID=728005 RepID=A0A0F5Q1Q0_9HYPH|nr:hemolysin III family protein [Devosia psychrophila]KKC34546.1 hemolysin III [Devosia psychrophila]SFD35883.1 hemolysin III [Devosia psychrophila]